MGLTAERYQLGRLPRRPLALALTCARTCNGMHPDTVPTMGRGRAKQKRDRGAGPDGGSAGVPAPVAPVPPAPSGGGNKPVPDHTSAPEDGSADDRKL
jgi:hypothetical protein